jgi:hypothetical protein
MFLNDMEEGGLVDSKGRRLELSFFSPFCKGLFCLSGGSMGWRGVNFFPFLKGNGRSVYGRRNTFLTFQRGFFLDGMGKGRFGCFCKGRERMGQGPPKYVKLLRKSFPFLKN